jgi:hypothetical protein
MPDYARYNEPACLCLRESRRSERKLEAPNLIGEKSAVASCNTWNTLMNPIQRPAWFSNVSPTMAVELPAPSISPFRSGEALRGQ